jgi:hypothetical protein
MSWNLLLYKAEPKANPAEEEMLPLGSPQDVAVALNATFPGLRWPRPDECELAVDGGFVVSLSIKDGVVSDLYTHGGYNHLRQFAALCLQHGWRMADAQEGEDLDLRDPYATYENPEA